YEEAYFERRKRLTVLALASWLWELPPYITALEDTIWAICEEYSWCLPAHMEYSSLKEDNRRRLDLFSCETGFALAEILCMLEKLLHPAIQKRAKDEVMYRVINSYSSGTELQKWELMENNWCAVCSGSIAGAAMYLLEDNKALSEILGRLEPTFERFINSFASDGACLEGLSYWTYGVGFYSCYADLLFHRTKGQINLLEKPPFKKIARFQQCCYFPGGASLQFSDANDGGKFRLGLSCYLVEHIDGVTIPVPRHLMTEENEISLENYHEFIDQCGRFALALRDLLWSGGKLPLPKENYGAIPFQSAEWLLCSGANETGFAAKGGNNDEPHNHNDVGSFIFYKKGEMFLLDLGAGEYTKDYFSDKRYTIFCNCSESHNIPIINGQGQKAGKEFAAKNCVINTDGNMVLDLAKAYDISGLERLERCFNFEINTGILNLKDSFIFTDNSPDLAANNNMFITERFILPAEPQILPGGCSLAINGSTCFLHCSEKITAKVSIVSHRDHDGKDKNIYTVDFIFMPKGNSFSVEFTVS
ncbi:MAG: heparinase II/III-family protein, partial [Treponema sp.]|nr:heparinase II/III-family protein [Treponema sp.]